MGDLHQIMNRNNVLDILCQNKELTPPPNPPQSLRLTTVAFLFLLVVNEIKSSNVCSS